MANRHSRRKAAASFKMTTVGRQFRVSAASGTTSLPAVTGTLFPETPSLSTIPREARRLYVALLMGIAESVQGKGIMPDAPTWRIAAWLYQYCRKGLARAVYYPDGSLGLKFPSDVQHEWTH